MIEPSRMLGAVGYFLATLLLPLGLAFFVLMGSIATGRYVDAWRFAGFAALFFGMFGLHLSDEMPTSSVLAAALGAGFASLICIYLGSQAKYLTEEAMKERRADAKKRGKI